MGVTDPIADMLTVMRNGSRAKKEKVDVKASGICKAILAILKQEGFIKDFKQIDDGKQGILRVYLRYTKEGMPSVTGLKRVSTPGLRIYATKDRLPVVRRGIGLAILTTSSGIMSNKDARKKGVGGEVICYAW